MKYFPAFAFLFLTMNSMASMDNRVDFGPLMQAVSKLQHISLVEASPHSELAGMPHLCWRATESGMEPFKSLPHALMQFSGQVDWYLIGDLPRICIFPQPKDFAEIRNDESEPFVAKVRNDIPALAAHLERVLGLEAKGSMGFNRELTSLELPEMVDYNSPNSLANVILVRDPIQFVQQWAPTSEFDRSLHVGITAEEYAFLMNERARIERGAQDADISKFFAGVLSQQSAILRTEQVEVLERQLRILVSDSSSNHIAAEKLISICRSARSYGLGIVIQFL